MVRITAKRKYTVRAEWFQGLISDLPKVTRHKRNKPLFVKVKSRSDTRTALVTDRFDIQAMSSF